MASVKSIEHVSLLFPTLKDQKDFLDEGSFDVALQQIQNQKIFDLPRGVAFIIADYIGPKNPINPCQLLIGSFIEENYIVTGQIIQELAALILFNPEVSKEKITYLANIQIYIISSMGNYYKAIMGKNCFFDPRSPFRFDESDYLKKDGTLQRCFERRAHKIVRKFRIRIYAQENREKEIMDFEELRLRLGMELALKEKITRLVDTIGPKAYVRLEDLEKQHESHATMGMRAAYQLRLRDNFNPNMVEDPPKDVSWSF